MLAFDQRPDWPACHRCSACLSETRHDQARAVDAGARVITPPLTQAYGHRGGRVCDPFGNIWWIIAVVEDVAPEDAMRRLSEPTYVEAMREAQETFDRELSGRAHGISSPPVVG